MPVRRRRTSPRSRCRPGPEGLLGARTMEIQGRHVRLHYAWAGKARSGGGISRLAGIWLAGIGGTVRQRGLLDTRQMPLSIYRKI